MRKHRVKRPDEAALRRLLEQEQASPEGAVLRLARRALDRGGLAGVQLMDLRHDWILRCLKEQDWPTVARISGVAVPALQARFSALVTPQKTEAEARSATLDEFRLWKILQVEKRTPAGLALWLAWQMGLRAGGDRRAAAGAASAMRRDPAASGGEGNPGAAGAEVSAPAGADAPGGVYLKCGRRQKAAPFFVRDRVVTIVRQVAARNGTAGFTLVKRAVKPLQSGDFFRKVTVRTAPGPFPPACGLRAG